MNNTIGIHNDADYRQTLWNCLISLRLVLDDPLQEESCYYKQKELYKVFLNKYISSDENSIRYRS